jgi:flagellar assembly factor FliW
MDQEDKKTIQTTRFGELSYELQDVIFFPRGIPGFETQREWALAGDEGSAIKWLQSLTDGSLALPVTTPDVVMPSYNARIPDDELELIEASKDVRDLALLTVLSIPEAEPWNMTVNLRAPIVVDTVTRKALQVIVLNEDYPVRHPVFPEHSREEMKDQYLRQQALQEDQ